MTGPTSPHITNIAPLAPADAKWIELLQISYMDQTGQSRTWEVASRKTRGRAGIDAVAIAPILLHPTLPPRTLLVIQYRPPLDRFTVEWPAGLVDAEETPEQAAVRELREETGYEGEVLEQSPTLAADPGMTSANMRVVMVRVSMKKEEEMPRQCLDEGEHIERVLVPLEELYDRLKEYADMDRMMVSAKLFHWAAGVHFARTMWPGDKR